MNKLTFPSKRAYKAHRDMLLDAHQFRGALVLKHTSGVRTLYTELQATDRATVLADLAATDASRITLYSANVDDHREVDAWREVNWASADIIEKFILDPEVVRQYARAAHDGATNGVLPLSHCDVDTAEGLAALAALTELKTVFLVTNRNPKTPTYAICLGKDAVEWHLSDTLGVLSQFIDKFNVTVFESDMVRNVDYYTVDVSATDNVRYTVDVAE